jgi:hypothetical protein
MRLPIDLAPPQLFLAENLILECGQVIVLAEVYQDKTYPEVIYFPQSSLAALELSKSDKSSFCPILRGMPAIGIMGIWKTAPGVIKIRSWM